MNILRIFSGTICTPSCIGLHKGTRYPGLQPTNMQYYAANAESDVALATNLVECQPYHGRRSYLIVGRAQATTNVVRSRPRRTLLYTSLITGETSFIVGLPDLLRSYLIVGLAG